VRDWQYRKIVGIIKAMSVYRKVAMVSTAKVKPHLSEAEYLAGERISDVKHEFIDGQTYAMSGASMNHGRICGNVFGEFRTHLMNSECEPVAADMQVNVGSSYFYPDVLVDCQFDESAPYSTKKPVIIVEVLSKSTRRTDQTTKRLRYINFPSLVEYVLIEQDFVDIEVMRKSDGWRSTRYYLGDEVTFESIDLTLSVEQIYHRVHNDDMLAFNAQKDN
jgi:Uma2 family endonuclease